MSPTFSISALVSWVYENRVQLIAAVLAIVAAASVLIKALEVLVSSIEKLTGYLVSVFPGLKGADDELKSIAAALDHLGGLLDALAKSSILNRLALSPKHAAPDAGPSAPTKAQGAGAGGGSGGTPAAVLVALAIGLALLCATNAQAQPVLSYGPSIPVVEVRSGGQVSVPAGAGVQVSVSLEQLQLPIFGKSYDMLGLDLMAFGSLVKGPAGDSQGLLQGALALCTLNSLICGGAGKDILGGSGWFGLIAVSFNFALEPPPTSGLSESRDARRRGATVYF